MITYLIIALTGIVSWVGFSNRSFFNRFSMRPYAIVRRGEWYRLLTHAFLHADWTHLLVNMLVFYSFGISMERFFHSLQMNGLIGHAEVAYLLLYFGAVLVSSLPDMHHRRDPYFSSIGASGAVTAVLFCSIFFHPWGKIYLMGLLPIPSVLFGAAYLFYEWYMHRRAGDRINHRAHLWGALYGLVFPLLLNPRFIHYFLRAVSTFDF